jgi:hypothetical protein
MGKEEAAGGQKAEYQSNSTIDETNMAIYNFRWQFEVFLSIFLNSNR